MPARFSIVRSVFSATSSFAVHRRPMSRFGRELMKHECVKHRESPDRVAYVPRPQLHDDGADERRHNPADNHPRHTERDEERSLFRWRELGEQRCHDRRAHAEEEPRDNAENREDQIVRCEYARNGEQAVHECADRENLSAPESVGQGARGERSDHDADRRPRRQGALRDVVDTELECDLRIRIRDDHVVVAVEHHGDTDEEENGYSELVDSDGVDSLGDGELPRAFRCCTHIFRSLQDVPHGLACRPHRDDGNRIAETKKTV